MALKISAIDTLRRNVHAMATAYRDTRPAYAELGVSIDLLIDRLEEARAAMSRRDVPGLIAKLTDATKAAKRARADNVVVANARQVFSHAIKGAQAALDAVACDSSNGTAPKPNGSSPE